MKKEYWDVTDEQVIEKIVYLPKLIYDIEMKRTYNSFVEDVRIMFQNFIDYSSWVNPTNFNSISIREIWNRLAIKFPNLFANFSLINDGKQINLMKHSTPELKMGQVYMYNRMNVPVVRSNQIEHKNRHHHRSVYTPTWILSLLQDTNFFKERDNQRQKS